MLPRQSTASAAGALLAVLLVAPVRAEDPKPRATLTGHTNQVWTLAFSPDGKTLASGAVRPDWDVRLWDVSASTKDRQAGGKEKKVLPRHEGTTWSVAFSPDGQLLAAAGSDREILVWEAESGKERAVLRRQGIISSIAFSPDSKLLASGDLLGAVWLWDVETGKERALITRDAEVRAVAFSPDGKLLVARNKWWDVAGGKVKVELAQSARCLAFSPDGKTLALGNGNDIELWDVAGGKATAILKGHPTAVVSLAFTPDGKTLASAAQEDPNVRLWDMPASTEGRQAGGKAKAVWKADATGLRAVALSPDGKTLATGGKDQMIKLWDLPQ
jgi:WD40 repeat protein